MEAKDVGVVSQRILGSGEGGYVNGEAGLGSGEGCAYDSLSTQEVMLRACFLEGKCLGFPHKTRSLHR